MDSTAGALQLKRIFDIVVSASLLLLLAVPMALIALAIRLRMGSPILFVQPRPGLDGEIFRLYKFRTMLDAVDEHGVQRPDAERLTPLGLTLRRTSLDELPELMNVLRGEMSLVGPRPLLPEYLPLYSEEQNRRHTMRPGVTGLAQVSGRNALSWDDKFSLDVRYVDTWSFGLDLRILVKTLFGVLRREGINQPGVATADRFLGADVSDQKGDQGPG